MVNKWFKGANKAGTPHLYVTPFIADLISYTFSHGKRIVVHYRLDVLS